MMKLSSPLRTNELEDLTGGNGANRDGNENSVSSASSCSKITLRRHNDKNHRRCVEVGENEAKSLLRKLLGSKAAVSVLGAGAQSPRREVFHGIERYIDFKVALDQGPIGRVCETCEIVRSSDKKNRKKLPCLLKSTPTPSAGNRFTATGGSNIPNGSSHMANHPCASWNCSTLSRERNPTRL